MTMTFEASLDWLAGREVCSGPFGLHRMEFLMERLEKPHLDVPGVLIGGTNGKGSVAAILESIVAATGDYQVGATISPHLVSVTERIRLGKRPMPPELWCEGVERLQEITSLMDREDSVGSPSFFELITALAFWAFRDQVDLGIIEVGLGGRLDATNVKNPEVAVLTNIGTDHMEILGPDRPTIAGEKLGIVKKKGCLITGEQDPVILDLFRADCQRKNAEFQAIAPQAVFSDVESHARGHVVTLRDSGLRLPFPLPGRHQLNNLALSLRVIARLRANGFEITDEAISQGVAEVAWPGRLQWLDGSPPVLLDGAHNEEGLQSLLGYLDEFPLPRPCTLIFGALKNKPVETMARQLGARCDHLVYVPPPTSRSLSRNDFEEVVHPLDSRWNWQDSLAEALAGADPKGPVLITGSLYLVAEYLRFSRTPI
jgi:dihydrofolate synthase/folylpolyglutamate synthase